jgi:hypothetical protein
MGGTTVVGLSGESGHTTTQERDCRELPAHADDSDHDERNSGARRARREQVPPPAARDDSGPRPS